MFFLHLFIFFNFSSSLLLHLNCQSSAVLSRVQTINAPKRGTAECFMHLIEFVIYLFSYSFKKLSPVHDSLFVNSRASGPPASLICCLPLLFVFSAEGLFVVASAAEAIFGTCESLEQNGRNRTPPAPRPPCSADDAECAVGWMESASFLCFSQAAGGGTPDVGAPLPDSKTESTHSLQFDTTKAKSSSATCLCNISVFSSVTKFYNSIKNPQPPHPRSPLL